MQPFVEALGPVSAVVWDASWQAACLAVLVWGMDRVFGAKLASRWRFALWSLVFVRLALPVVPLSPTSVFRLWPTPSTRTDVYFALPDDVNLASSRVTHRAAVTAQATKSRTQIGWTRGLAASVVWLIGVVALGARRVVQHLRLARRGKSWRKPDDPRIEPLLADCRRRVGVRSRVIVVVSDDDSGPALTGVVPPRIVLPDAVLREFSEEQLEMILLHELAHVRRRDMLVRETILALRIVHWFNPAAWWAFHRMEVEREIACDELVLDVTGAARRQSYGLTLLNVVQRASAPVLSPGLLGASDKATRLQRRLALIRDYRARSWKMTLLGVTMIALASALGLTNPPAAHTTEGPQTTETSAPDDAVNAGSQETQPNEPANRSSNRASKTPFEVKGRCLDDGGNPLKEAEVVLFLFHRQGVRPTKTWRRQTGASGEYRFGDLEPLSELELGTERYCVAARKPNFASSARMIFARDERSEFDLTLASSPGTLSGRVTNEREEPLEGADVFVPRGGVPLPGFMSAVTDKDGRFAIPDLKPWNAKDTATFDNKTGSGTVVSQYFIYVKHADYPLTRGGYSSVPQEVDVQLTPGMIIEGRVVDIVTGRLAAGAVVSAQGTKDHGWAQVIADQNGEYRLVLTADRYNICAQTNDRTSVALDSFAGPTGRATRAPDLDLIHGGYIVGEVIDKTTGKPLSKLPDGEHLSIGHHGPAFPISGAAVGTAAVADDGTYRLRVAPGANYPYLMHKVDAERTLRNAMALKPIIVHEGETVTLDFQVGAACDP